MSLRPAALIIVTILILAGGVAGWMFHGTGSSKVDEEPEEPPAQEPPPSEPPGPNWTLTGRLRPGASLGGYCTLNFLFEYPDGKLAIGTAGHCNEVNDTVSNPDVGEFGVVVYSVDDFGGRNLDFALIDIYEHLYDEANPQVRRWGGPTAHTTASQTNTGELIDVYGYAVGVGANEQTRARTGILSSDDEQTFDSDIPVWWGDSGGPLVMDDDRAGLGVVSRAGSTSTLTGSTVEYIMYNLEADGFEVELVLAEAL